MNLAVILFLGTSSLLGTSLYSPAQTQTQSTPQEKSTPGADAQGQALPQAPSPAAPGTVTEKKPASKPHHKKKYAAADCNATTPAPTNGSKGANTAKPANSSAPSNCPLPKVIVKQGGTTEPAIQLVPGAKSPQNRDTAQKLQTTEENLKKVESTNPDSNQQDMIKQIRQFVEESKSATASGDLDRASTLAAKAQLLSEELVSPQK